MVRLRRPDVTPRSLPGQASERKSRPAATACGRILWPYLTEGSREAVRVAERMADGSVVETTQGDAVVTAREDRIRYGGRAFDGDAADDERAFNRMPALGDALMGGA